MYISEISIENFKSIQRIKITPNREFNIIIGANNIGKSSIFEALALWKKCYELSITKSNSVFYKKEGNNYINFNDLSFLRFQNNVDIYLDKNRPIKIEVEVKEEDEKYNIGFEIDKAGSIPNSYFRFNRIYSHEFTKFEEFIKEKNKKLSESIFIYQTKPLANVIKNEPFMTKGQVLKKISSGKSQEVLRNKIISHLSNQGEESLKNKISRVLEECFDFNFSNKNYRTTDEYIDLRIKKNNKELDIQMQGSGFLQVAEIFSSIEYFDSPLNLLLVDEPDSHIHAKLQKNLINELQELNNTQTFVISHNEKFLDNLSNSTILYINDENKIRGEILPINSQEIEFIKSELGGTISGIEKLNHAKSVILVEGKDDINYIKNLFRKINDVKGNIYHKSCVFLYLRGKDDLNIKIRQYKRLIEQIVNDKAIKIVVDKDFSTKRKRTETLTNLNKQIGNNKNYIHNGYCVESTIFSNKEKLVRLTKKIANNKDDECIRDFINSFYTNIYTTYKNHDSTENKEMNEKYKSQKHNRKDEFGDDEFSDFIRDISTEEEIHYLMNKSNIKKFCESLKNELGEGHIEFNGMVKDEEYSKALFDFYIENISCDDDIYEDHINLINTLYELKA